MITLSDSAVQELKALVARKGASPTAGLRLGVQRGGCAGLQYTMQVAEPGESDQQIEQDGARIFIAPDSAPYLRGCHIEFSDDLSDSGFKIVNPNASRACGCGTSFEAKDDPEATPYDPSLDGTKCS